MSNLWNLNTPKNLWLCDLIIDDHQWQEAIRKSVPLLGLDVNAGMDNPDVLVELTLGEGRFGTHHWDLGSVKRLYYLVKPILPRFMTRLMRQYYGSAFDKRAEANWPIDARYVQFQWELMRQLLLITGRRSISYKNFWPGDHRFTFVLTHDIETAQGQKFVRKIADMEENLGFRSSFNFVLERYTLDLGLIQELKQRGFEVGCHGLKHDGKLYNSKAGFDKRATQINAYLDKFEMVGFRSPLTHRNPEWMQILDIEYDSSFFDTDPFEPIPGGAMTIWPFFIGHFVELPYTLVQDYTLTAVLGETSSRIWLDKVAFIEKYHGLALINSHPDYLKEKNTWNVYMDFLKAMKSRNNYWHALPYEVARWWRLRTQNGSNSSINVIRQGVARLKDGQLVLDAER